jgi:hypothetical protein
MIIINELRYLVWHVVWLMDEDATKSVIEWREDRPVSEDYPLGYDVIQSSTSTDMILSGTIHDDFNNYCWEALSRGSRSMMQAHAASRSVEI